MSRSARPTANSTPLALTVLFLAITVFACSSDSGGAASPSTTTKPSASPVVTEPVTQEPEDTPEPSAEERPYVDAIVKLFGTGDTSLVGQANLECMSRRWVTLIGVSRFAVAEVSADRLASGEIELSSVGIDEEVASKMVGELKPCGIDARELVRQTFTSGRDLTQAQAACLDEKLTSDVVSAYLMQAVSGADGDGEALGEAVACLS